MPRRNTAATGEMGAECVRPGVNPLLGNLRRLNPGRSAGEKCIALAWIEILSALLLLASSARGDESTSFCPRCKVLVGLGTTYRFSAWTDGIVVPLTLELDESRWELGAFRFANAQRYGDNAHATHPYWGFTAMRRARGAKWST
jgi:hypothetical protein